MNDSKLFLVHKHVFGDEKKNLKNWKFYYILLVMNDSKLFLVHKHVFGDEKLALH